MNRDWYSVTPKTCPFVLLADPCPECILTSDFVCDVQYHWLTLSDWLRISINTL